MKLKPAPSLRRVPRDAARTAEAPEARGAAAPRSDVRGLIDNATADRLYGWAWDAAYPGRRLKIELRLAGEVVANTIADFVRPDLAKLGVGDGCHAFEFPLTPDWAARKSDLTAVAFGVDGTEVPIAMRIRRPEEMAGMPGQLQRVVEAILNDQQQLRADIAALREEAGRAPAAVLEGLAASQEDLARKVEAVEIWLTRLDGRLGDAPAGERPGAAAPRGSVDLWEAVLFAVLAGACSAALAVAATYHFSV